MTHNIATLVTFPVLAAYSVSTELLTPRGAGRAAMFVVCAFVFVALATGASWEHVAANVSCGLVVLMITFMVFCVGWMTSGDAKLVSATVVWLGWDHLAVFALAALVLALVISFALERWRASPLSPALASRDWVARLHAPGGQIPYGVAAAVAGVLLYPGAANWEQILQSL